LGFADAPVSAKTLATLVKRIEDNTVSGKAAKEVLDALMLDLDSGVAIMEPDVESKTDYLNAIVNQDVDSLIDQLGLKQVSDTGAIETIVDGILAANQDKVAEYKAGKEKLFGFFVGQTMKASKGSANPQAVNEVLKQKLS
jgi:aspartyl-tRNA(Asn)/glutamyl-tRNA(Gln) amidotransferase subunit B